ncbi:MAG TPA: hypothetical protein VJT81_06670 [Burkholderiales bacterium]|nr:hypothetical protein [Burkholderiales bacterium]
MNQTIEISYPDSPRIGKFRVLHEFLRDGSRRPMLQALNGLCVILHTEDDETGRGKMFYAASELFQPITEGEEIPEYRIECATNMPFENPEYQRDRINSGIFGFVAIRKIILRVPTLTTRFRPNAVH